MQAEETQSIESEDHQFWTEFDDILIKPPVPKTKLFQENKEITCYVSLPDVQAVNDMIIDVYDHYLQITGKATRKNTNESGMGKHHPLNQKIALPFPVERDKIGARYHEGLLILRLYRLN